MYAFQDSLFYIKNYMKILFVIGYKTRKIYNSLFQRYFYY